MVSRRMAMVETNNDRNGIVVHRSIGQRNEPTKIPGVTEQLMLATLVDSGVAVL